MIAEFGSLGAALSGSPLRVHRAVAAYPEIANYLPCVRQAMALALLRDVLQQPQLSTFQALLDYLHVSMAHLTREQVHILHLNAQHRLIRDEMIADGTIDEAPLYVREVMRRCLELGSAGIVVVHNHPSGDATPSRVDIDITRKMAEAGRRLNVAVHDHIIIAERGHSSLRSMGLL